MRGWAIAAPQAVGSPPPSRPTLEPLSRALQTCQANRALCKGWTEGPCAGRLLLGAALAQQGSLHWRGDMQIKLNNNINWLLQVAHSHLVVPGSVWCFQLGTLDRLCMLWYTVSWCQQPQLSEVPF